MTDTYNAGLNDEEAAHQSAEEHEAETEVSPVDRNWREARETMSQQRDMIKRLEGELYQIRMHQQQNVQPSPEEDEYEVVDRKTLKSVLTQKEREFQARIAEIEAKSKYPDMMEVIEKYGQKLPLEVRRALAQSGDLEAAYHACKSSSEYFKDQMRNQQHENARKAEDNLKKPRSPSATGGGSAALSKASYYANLSPQELIEMGNKFARG